MKTLTEFDLRSFPKDLDGYIEVEKIPGVQISVVSKSDYEAIGSLDYLTIQGTPEADGESEDELIQEMKSTFAGKYGTLIDEASFVLKLDGILVSAVVIVLYLNDNVLVPLVANAMTHPEFQRRQFISVLLHKSVRALLLLNRERLAFAIHPENIPSLSLARKFAPQ